MPVVRAVAEGAAREAADAAVSGGDGGIEVSSGASGRRR